MSLGLATAFMLTTSIPSLQSAIYYPDNASCQEVALGVNSSRLGEAQCHMTRVPTSIVPGHPKVSAYMLITNLPSAGVQIFYGNNIACQETLRSLTTNGAHFKGTCRLVRVPQEYVR